MTIIHIFPTSDSAKDVEVLRTALNGGTITYNNGTLAANVAFAGASEDDTVLMHYEKEDRTGKSAGEHGVNDGQGVERWLLDDPGTDCSAGDLTIQFYSGSCDYLDWVVGSNDFWDTTPMNTQNIPISVTTKVSIKGKELKEMGFKPGPLYKEIFNRLLEARLNGRIITKEDEISFVRKNF